MKSKKTHNKERKVLGGGKKKQEKWRSGEGMFWGEERQSGYGGKEMNTEEK